MKSSIGNLLIAAAIGLIVGFFIGRSTVDTEVIEVPIKIDVPVPVVESDTIVKDSLIPVKVRIPNPINDELLQKYDSIKDEVLRRDAYINAISKREYNEVFDDSIQTINVRAVTTGTLDTLSLKYKTKPRTIPLDTVITVKNPSKSRSIQAYIEAKAVSDDAGLAKYGVDYISKKGFILGGSQDTDGNFWLKFGKAWRF